MKTASNELGAALSDCRAALVSLVVVSGLVNVLYLNGSLFMLVVYDRVIPSRSVPSLVGIVLLAVMLYAFQGALEAMRGRLLARVAAVLDESLSPSVFRTMLRGPASGALPGGSTLPMQDLDQVRAFLSSSAPSALCDLPWMPLYFAICFLFHPLIGVTALAGALLLVAITFATDRLTRRPLKAVSAEGVRRAGIVESACRNSDVLVAMGMQEHFAARWQAASEGHLAAHQQLTDVAGALGAVSKMSRMALQSGVLALCAYLVIDGQGTSGILLASSILLGRALAPLDSTIANWKNVAGARQSWTRLVALARNAPAEHRAALAAPFQTLTVENVVVAAPGAAQPAVRNLSFGLKAGQAVAVVGPSGSGKSSLVRALIGVWPAQRGTVRLDGVAIDQWARADLGRHIGYLPQEVGLFSGTIAQNIARFAPDATREAIEAAARSAGIHEFVRRLPGGYETELGEGGLGLSGGQRQRIGLARALYGAPFLVVLDEPNAHLDGEGESALVQAIHEVRARGGLVVLVAHRPSVLAAVDLVLTMEAGQGRAFGPRDAVLRGRRPGADRAASGPAAGPAHPAIRIVPAPPQAGNQDGPACPEAQVA